MKTESLNVIHRIGVFFNNNLPDVSTSDLEYNINVLHEHAIHEIGIVRPNEMITSVLGHNAIVCIDTAYDAMTNLKDNYPHLLACCSDSSKLKFTSAYEIFAKYKS